MNASAAAPVWFITGCSSGIGRALAERVLSRGYRCAATARNPDSLAELVAAHPGRALAFALDVTDHAQVNHATGEAERAFGRIDVLVNNAGFGYNAAVEEADERQVRAMFDTNVFGLAAVMWRVLPGMRARQSGHIFNVSSVGGLIGNPGSAFYCASKFAVEGLSQGLAKEVAPLGIKVTLVEPGPFRTEFQGRSIKVPDREIEDYATTAGARRNELRASSGAQPGDPVRAADAIIDLYESASPPLQIVFGKIALDRVRGNLKDRTDSVAAWESVSVATDFPVQ